MVMKTIASISRRLLVVGMGASLALCTTHFSVLAQQELSETLDEKQIGVLPGKQVQVARNIPDYDAYILGPGDSIQIELLDLPEFSGTRTIGPDGTLYLPRLRALYVEGLTVEELRYFLAEQYSSYVLDPQVYVHPVVYRPIRAYIGGEVQRPGYYYLSGQQEVPNQSVSINSNLNNIENINNAINQFIPSPSSSNIPAIGGVRVDQKLRLPTVFDALRIAGGVTPFSKLGEVTVTRKRPLSQGGGKIRAQLNFLELITEGNESQNIRLFDGDTIVVARSQVELREQIIKAGQTNLSPDFLQVYVSGRVRNPGAKVLPQGATLDQALAASGGQKLLRGNVEFVRFNRDGTTDRRKFNYSQPAPAGSKNNPVLMTGDLINVNESPLSAFVSVLDEVTTPIIGLYSTYALFEAFAK